MLNAYHLQYGFVNLVHCDTVEVFVQGNVYGTAAGFQDCTAPHEDELIALMDVVSSKTLQSSLRDQSCS